jgi:hypothetical protein
MTRTGNAALLTALAALGTAVLSAQPVISAKSGMVSRTEGAVFIGEKNLETSPAQFPEVKENDVLRTTEGRAEILLTRGVVMRIGEQASFKMLTNRLIDTRLEILAGSAIVVADEIVKDNNLTILAKDASMNVSKHGIYRFDIEAGTIKVFDGAASVEVGGETVLVGAGRMLKMESGKPVIEKFNKDETDALDNWSKRRAEQMAMANPSSAKQLHDLGCNSGPNIATHLAAATTNPNDPCFNSCDNWRYNRWYGLITYIPCNANMMSPYGYRYWAPNRVMRAYYVPPPPVRGTGSGDPFGGMGAPAYSNMGSTAGGYAGAMSSATSVSASPAAAASSGTTAASSAGSSSAGHGAAAGHGK